MSDSTPSEITYDLVQALEALLFAAPGAVSLAQLTATLDVPEEDIVKGLGLLDELLQTRGLRLQSHNQRFQLTTAPELAPLIERFIGLEAASRLSRAALEALAIIAYQQPTTRPEIDNIRGVNSDGVLKSLLSKGLIQEGGRADRPGRPILYETTADFLGHFGLASLRDLPSMDDLVAESPKREEPSPDLLKT